MNGPSPRLRITQPRSAGRADRPAAIRLGFRAEPVVDLLHFDASALYSECLARVMIDGRMSLAGGDCIGELEASGDIGLLDAAVAGLVLDALADDPRAYLACNVSPRTLADADAWGWLLRCIGTRAWLAGRLTLEITESLPLDEIAEAAARLAEARRLGCRLAIDDFGAGFAVPARLRRVDIAWDVVKIDRGCFRDPPDAPRGRERLRALVLAAEAFAPVVVVEGIETRRHLAAAREAGARYGQGWLFEARAPQRWTVPDDETARRLLRAMAPHAALERWLPAGPAENGAAGGDLPQPARNRPLSRAERLGGRMRALLGQGGTGGVS